MDGTKSKFDYEIFYGWPDVFDECLVINRAKYTLEQARAVFEIENMRPCIEIIEASVRYGAGIDDDGEKQVGWWVDFRDDGSGKRRCPVWLMR